MRSETPRPRTLLLLVTNDWYVASHRLALVRAAVDAGWRVVIGTQVLSHRDVLEAMGAEVVHLAWWRPRAAWKTRNPFALLVDVARLYRRIRPDIVHCVALRPVLFGSLAARFVPVPAIVNAMAGQGFIFVSKSRVARMMRPIIKRALYFALTPNEGQRGRTILQNPDDRDFLVRERLLHGHRVDLIRGAGVDLREFTPGAPPTGTPVVVLPARMLWEKGVAEFVAAARQLREAGVRARFVLVGDTITGNPRWVDPGQLMTWQQEGVIEWWGHRSDMADVFRNCHIVALPSYGEGMPKALLEAAAAGRAIVTTDVAGCREVVREGDNGLLVRVRDSRTLAYAIRRLIEDVDLRIRMGARGRARAEREFSVERVVEATLRVYERLWGELSELKVDEGARVQRREEIEDEEPERENERAYEAGKR